MRSLSIDFGQISELCGHLTQEHASELQRRELLPTTEAFARRSTVRKIDGAQRMDKIMRLCTSLPGYTLSYFQLQCLHIILACIAPIVFKGCSAAEMATYLRKMNMGSTDMRMVFLETSRRSGKTDILAIITAACLLVIPQLGMLGWSLHNDTSELFGETVAMFINDMNGKHRMGKNKARVYVRPEEGNGERSVIRLQGSKNPNVSLSIYLVRVVLYCLVFR